MIRSILHRAARSLARRYSYDTTYLHEVIDVSPGAAMGMQRLRGFYKYRGSKAGLPVWFGALLASTLEGDCGPCVQLVIDMALEQGIEPAPILACVEGRPHEAGPVGLGFRFAGMAIADDLETDTLRCEIQTAFGRKAAISCALAAAAGRVYPVMKRGLGHGKACQKLDIAGHIAKLAA